MNAFADAQAALEAAEQLLDDARDAQQFAAAYRARSAAWERLASTSPPVAVPFYRAALIAAQADAEAGERWAARVEGGGLGGIVG